MSTNMTSLFDFGSRMLDEELGLICGQDIISSSKLYDSCYDDDYLFPLPAYSGCLYDFNSFESINQAVRIYDQAQNIEETQKQQKIILTEQIKIKSIEKPSPDIQDQSDSENTEPHSHTQTSSTFTYSRKQKKQKLSYPTKNFLPNFKGPHLEFLQKFYGAEFLKKFPIISELKLKSGISMQDYENLYKTPHFQDAFVEFFQKRVLYRELLISRSTNSVKKIHQKKLYVFEQAFKKKSFTRIN